MTNEQRNLLLAISNDASYLFNKVKERMPVYIEVFSVRRERHQFNWVFENKFKVLPIQELAKIPLKFIPLIDDFYNSCDELHWFLMYTEEMPAAIETFLQRSIHKLEKKLDIFLSSLAEYLGDTIDTETEEEPGPPLFETEEELPEE